MNRPFFHIILLCFLVYSAGSFAQQVSNVAVSQEGKNIVVTYDLKDKGVVSLSSTARNGEVTLHPKSVSGDVGKTVRSGKNKRIVWNVLADYGDQFIYDDVRFTVKATPPRRTFILAEGAFSPSKQWGAGVMFGRMNEWGWFVKARSNYAFYKSMSGLTAEGEKGIISGTESAPFYSGKKSSTELMIDAGVVARLWHPLYAYLGAGYGIRRVYWQTTDEQWVYHKDNSYHGVSADFGFLAYLGGFALSVGVNTINFKYVELELGMGVMF